MCCWVMLTNTAWNTSPGFGQIFTTPTTTLLRYDGPGSPIMKSAPFSYEMNGQKRCVFGPVGMRAVIPNGKMNPLPTYVTAGSSLKPGTIVAGLRGTYISRTSMLNGGPIGVFGPNV